MLNQKQKEFLLIPKALPTSTHFINLRQMLPRNEWDRLRKKVYSAASNRCELCGSDQRLEAHEIWMFDFEKKVQYLETLAALCMHCHRFQHVNLLALQEDQGIAHSWGTINHFNKLTGQKVTQSQFFAMANKEAIKLENIEWEVVINRSFDELFQ